MLRWAILFLIIAIIAGFFGFGSVAGIAWDGAKLLCFVFLIFSVVSFIFDRRWPRDVS